MDKDQKVEVISTVNAQVNINVPELRLNRTWAQKGAKHRIDFGILEEAIYDPGVQNIFEEGTLYIEDMAVKIALGLEPEGADKPENIIILSDAQKKRYLTVAPVHELKDILNKISVEQAKELAHYAVSLKITDMARTNLIKEKSGIDVIKTIMFQDS